MVGVARNLFHQPAVPVAPAAVLPAPTFQPYPGHIHAYHPYPVVAYVPCYVMLTVQPGPFMTTSCGCVQAASGNPVMKNHADVHASTENFVPPNFQPNFTSTPKKKRQ